ncbi:MAG: BON domain-containing protein [Povalibacter sp.]
MSAPSNRQQNSRAPSDDRPFDHPSDDREDLFDDGSFRQGANITDGPQESRSRGGGFSEVSPGGGEYLSGGPRQYGSDAYPDQGFGKKTRASSHWRTEDRIFGTGSVVNEPTPGQIGTYYRNRGPKGYRRPDDRIREDACELLTDDLFVDATDIDVQVSEAEITLDGTVHSRYEKRRAEDLVERIRGVSDVHNRLRVTP